MISDLAPLAFSLAFSVLSFLAGRMSERHTPMRKREAVPPAATPAPIAVVDGDAQLGAKIRSTLESMTLKARISGRGFVIEQRASAQIHGLRIAIHYTLETDQLPSPVEVEARR